MTRDKKNELSHSLSRLLRHGAIPSRLAMDAAGWADIGDVVRVLHIDRARLDEAVRDNTKQRLEVRGDRIRAAQGHSLAGTPVTLEALEASWVAHEGDASVFHGTSLDALDGIAREGILPGERTHVHLADAIDSAVGKRARVDVMIEVSPVTLRSLGIALHRSPNGVILARVVPVAAITGVRPQTERARGRMAERAW